LECLETKKSQCKSNKNQKTQGVAIPKESTKTKKIQKSQKYSKNQKPIPIDHIPETKIQKTR
jgi:hypothetical protein